ncbi:hypothetical protein NDU88_004419 [Pleurodeles waltl]|uniref:Uncharacterized protein n=1 Tax=Pleurodeles waltl TaxID=8319 RepID=A0AAV7PCF4_PLEWA|nr:hypothetical protein NDU88_004419 [Pleurodeles waltl]
MHLCASLYFRASQCLSVSSMRNKAGRRISQCPCCYSAFSTNNSCDVSIPRFSPNGCSQETTILHPCNAAATAAAAALTAPAALLQLSPVSPAALTCISGGSSHSPRGPLVMLQQSAPRPTEPEALLWCPQLHLLARFLAPRLLAVSYPAQMFTAFTAFQEEE